MSGPNVEMPPPPPDPEWLRRYDAKMAELMAERAKRIAEKAEPEPEAER